MSRQQLIEPRILKGFRDLLPHVAIPRAKMLDQIRRVFDLFGYVPIETPALEYTEILLGKGSDETDKQLFRFTDQGGRDVSLRFDLTVPLARFAAMYSHELGVPFRRYHIAPVWRAEKPQRGRFREFTQCDFDIIGTRSPLADAEIISLIDTIFTRLEISHRIRINHRGILNGFLHSLEGTPENANRSVAVLRAIDKLEKLGRETVAEELSREAGLSTAAIEKVFAFIAVSKSGAPASFESALEVLGQAAELAAGNETAGQGIADLRSSLQALSQGGADLTNVTVDLSIARGLEYYTGIVFETQSTDLPDIGSICSGGRYDNLAGLYTKRDLPGVGASVGLDRTLAALEELGRISAKSSTAEVLVCLLDEGSEAQVMGLAQSLRSEGVPVEVFPEHAKLGNQIKYAVRKGMKIAVIAGQRELSNRTCSFKHLESGQQTDNIPLAQAASAILTRLQS